MTNSAFCAFVPIHTRIRPMVEAKYKEAVACGSEYLFTSKGKKITYDKYKYNFNSFVRKLGLNQKHRPHDPRVHFVTMAKKYNVDEYTIKLLVGHSVEDLTERVYTKRDLEWLRKEIEKIR